MKAFRLNSCASTFAIAAAFVVQPAFAQTASTPTNPAPASAPVGDPNATPGGNAPGSGALTNAQSGNEIVVTAAPGDRSRFKSSASISQISGDAIKNFTPRSVAEVLRTIPGIQTAANAGPGGNANIGVRGIPVSTGGSEYVALQEDGLPVTLFGDIQFGNNDYWLRFDDTVERVEAIRGGSASTFASQAPGAVINYISNTGEKQGGTIGYTEGLDFRQHQLNANYAYHVSDTLRFDIGGYARTGSGPSDISYNILRGYQVKANATKDFADGKGFIRILFKRLDERAPTNTTTPAIANLNGKQVTSYTQLPNFDPRDGSSYSKYDRNFQYVNSDGKLETTTVDGIHPKVTSIGAQFHYDVDSHIKVDDTIRKTWMSGNFTTKFLNVASTSSVIGSTINGQTVGSIRYADGPQVGQAFTGSYLNNNPNIHVDMRNMGSFANNLAFTGKYALGPGQATLTAGWFHMSQTIDQTWMVNRQFSEIRGKNAAELDLFSTTGTQLTAAGQAGYNDNWGSGGARNENLNYTDDAAFGSAGYVWDKLNVDGSVRFDRVSGKGSASAGETGPNYLVTDALGTASIPSIIPGAANAERIDYLKAYTSWSVGALYSLTNETSLFVRASRGGRFNADRRTLAGSVGADGVYSGGNFNANGSLNAQGNATAVNYLNQQEAGLKQRGSFSLFGRQNQYTAEATFFHSTLTETNYDFTRTNNAPPNNNPNISNKYRAYGVEFTGNIAIDNFRITANMTYTNSKITNSLTAPTTIGDVPGSIPKFQYFVQGSYDRELFAVGASVDGQTSSYFDDFDQYKLKPSVYVNAFLKIRPVRNIELGLNVNNVFNTLGFRGGGSLSAIANGPLAFSGTANYGRTTEASLRFNF